MPLTPELTVRWSTKIACPASRFHDFIQKMANRWLQGHLRYGPPNHDKRYLSRIKLELRAYETTGNLEHLYNVANYCALESIAPENPKFHYDNGVSSVTRGKIK